METLHDKRALNAAGAAKRVGRSLALGLAAAGADVAITYNGSKAEAQETVAALQQLNVRAMAVACDVRNIDSVQAAVAAVVEEFGGAGRPGRQRERLKPRCYSRSPWLNGTRCSRRIPAGPSWCPRQLILTCGKPRAASSISARWVACIRGPRTRTIAPQRRLFIC